MSKGRDIFSIEIIKNSLESIADEMFWITIRTSKSPIFYETFDFSTAITDADGNTLAISVGLPLWLGVMKFLASNMINEVQKYDELHPGDIIISNDPYLTGTHTNDVGLAMPIFYKGEIIAIATAKGHVYDVGGLNPGTWGPGSKEIYHEGLFIPPVKYYREGEPNKEVIQIIKSNSRVPGYVYGDLEALAAAMRLADRRIKELIDKYGIEAYKEAINSLLGEGKKVSLERLRELPKGEYDSEDYLDDDYVTGNPLKIKAKIKITDKKFIVDFRENPKCVNAPINNTYPGTVAAVSVVYVATIDPHIHFNQGILEPLEIIAPPGTLFHAVKPYPCSVYWETLAYAADLVWKPLAPIIPERLSAGHFLSVVAETIAGIDPRTNEYFILVEPNPGGWGGQIDRDGESALVSFMDGETYANPVEILERRFPILVDRFELNLEDGTGHGKYRGGFGIIKDYRILTDNASLTTAINRSRFSPWSVNGGKEGTTNYILLIKNNGERMRISRIVDYKLNRNDVVSIRSGGGGGWGDPLERDPELVLKDVMEGYITIEIAEKEYGVVIDKNKLEIDWKAIEELRSKLKQH